MTTNKGRHTQNSPEWYTPSPIVEAARKVMGSIDVDPASCEEANRIVQARTIYTKENDGLAFQWTGNVFLNPPGEGDLVKRFWVHACEDWFMSRFQQLIWVGYSLEQLQSLQQSGALWMPMEFAMCIPRKRIAFVENAAMRRARIKKLRAAGKSPNLKSSPSHSNYIVYMGPDPKAFEAEFEQFGHVTIPHDCTML